MKKLKALNLLFLLIIVIIILVAISLFKEEKFTVIIDPGHGGNAFFCYDDNSAGYPIDKIQSLFPNEMLLFSRGDPGAVEDELLESHINLDISLFLADILEQKGYQVVLTRKNDTALSLRKRVEIANKYENRNSLFLSIHQNSPWSTDRVEAHLYPLSDTLNEDQLFAKSILYSFTKLRLGNSSIVFEPVLFAEDVFVLVNKKIPGILLEVNYLSNPTYGKWISKEKNKLLVAQTIAEGIDLYVKKCRKNNGCDFLPEFAVKASCS